MRNPLAAAVLAATASVCFSGPPAPAADAPAADAPATPAAPAAHKPAERSAVPVKQVVLFSSGVGYFEHFGTVEGSGSTDLLFKSAQINDILKSLVLQDLDKGRVEAVTYPSQDPVAKTLKSFQVDITSNPALHDLLEQLRGASVAVNTGAQDLQGTVLGVEKKQRPAGDKGGGQVVDVWMLNLITGDGIRQVPLDDVRDVKLQDPRLRDELHRALAALASARDQDKKPVTIRFAGQGERRVRIGYVVETPVWKTSYRLLLSDQSRNAENAEKTNAGEPPRAAPGAGAAPGGAGAKGAKVDGKGEGSLQGWAIVENQTDNDWNDVQLSLVSGRPISFIQDLYQPLYIPRPVVQPELYASLRPQTYDAGSEQKMDQLSDFSKQAGADRSAGEVLKKASAARGLRAPAAATPPTPSAAAGAVPAEEAEKLGAMDAAASVASVASAAKVGELFQYTVGDVSLPRQTSAMIPIVTDPVEVERLSIYNAGVLPRNPLNGARVKNTTGKHLLAGPLTVFDAGTYAGDAQIDNVPPGQERLISYGVDQQVLVDATKNKQDQATLTGRIVKGVLTVSRRYSFTQEYVAENKGEKDKTLVIEHPRRGGEWKLVQPAKADETTDALYRFKGRVAAGKGTKLTVGEQAVTDEQVAILPLDGSQLEVYIRTGPIPQKVKDALAKAAQLKGRLADTQRQSQEREQQIQLITAEQNRIRENMKTVAQNSDYYTRLLKKLNDQETQIEKLQGEVRDLQKAQDQQRKELEDYLSSLTVEG